MIVDASAVIAILWSEPGFEELSLAIENSRQSTMSAMNFLEAAIIADGTRRPEFSEAFDIFIRTAKIEIAPVTESHARIARQAYRDFGKGSGHRAKLNMGDCFAYALAKATGEPLLFKGNDFIHTDITSALN